MNAEMKGRTPVGRPPIRWKDVLRRDLASSGLSLGKAATEARTATDGRLSCRPHATTTLREVKSSQVKNFKIRYINSTIRKSL